MKTIFIKKSQRYLTRLNDPSQPARQRHSDGQSGWRTAWPGGRVVGHVTTLKTGKIDLRGAW